MRKCCKSIDICKENGYNMKSAIKIAVSSLEKGRRCKKIHLNMEF